MSKLAKRIKALRADVKYCELVGDVDGKKMAESELKKILGRIAGIKDPIHRLIMHKHYIQGLPWAVVADDLGCSMAQIYRLRVAGLLALVDNVDN